MSVVRVRIADERRSTAMSAGAMTGSTMTHDGFAGGTRIHGVGGVAVRLGRAIERWGRRVAEPMTREQQELRVAIEREARESIVSRGDAHTGAFRLLR
jgi:hypothetical protein